jgi:ribosomal protein L37AE/L43A
MRLNFGKLTRFRVQPDRSHEVRYNCPECGDLNGKLYANFDKGVWTCFHCGNSGSISRRDMVIAKGQRTPFAFLKERPREFKWTTHPDIRGTGLLYLEKHNVPQEVAWAWGVRSGKDDSKSRLVIPVKYRTAQGTRTVFRVAHASSDSVYPKELQSGDRMFQDRTAILVEGAADAFRLHARCKEDPKLRNFLSVVCLWGKQLSEDTAFNLVGLFENFYVMLDREEGLEQWGEKNSSMKIMHKLQAIATGQVTRHSWERDASPAGDPAELTNLQVDTLLHLILRRTGG